MRRDPALGNAFLDVALAGSVLTLIGLLVDAVIGNRVNVLLLGAALISNGAYVIASLRLGVSPVAYIRHVTKRS